MKAVGANDYERLFGLLEDTRLKGWLESLPNQVASAFDGRRYGDLPKWRAAIESLPEVIAAETLLDVPAVTVRPEKGLSEDEKSSIEASLRGIHPWRKGPFDMHGVYVDTEWRSDLKWARVQPHLASLKDRLVLDVGCGNAYYLFRMLGEEARLVVGVDPYVIYIMQYLAIKHFMPELPAFAVPLGVDDLPQSGLSFDTVFSMGVIYHRKSPLDHLSDLSTFLRDGGELVLETLVVDGPEGYSLVPDGRYAKMRNVWFIPSVLTLEKWLQRCGYKNVRTVDVTASSIDEQRVTDWMSFESLADFLDPKDSSLTIEGYPAPKRAVVLAEKA